MLQKKLYSSRIAYRGRIIPNTRDPLKLFSSWYKQGARRTTGEPNAMVLATCRRGGYPSARWVLLKSFDPDGFVFFTNTESRKATELKTTPRAALLFYWHHLHRQIRIEGFVKSVSRKEADEYFASRPRGSQIAAWASMQSKPLLSRAELQERFLSVEERFRGHSVPRPPFWGGYRVVPVRFEFWSGMPNRMHDRVEFHRASPGAVWQWHRLFP